MASTPWHSPRLVRGSLVLGVLALVFAVPFSAAHLACDHADDQPTGRHQCAVCRHLQDGTPFLVASLPTTAPTPVADLVPRQSPTATSLPVPTAHGRSPPAHDSVS